MGSRGAVISSYFGQLGYGRAIRWQNGRQVVEREYSGKKTVRWGCSEAEGQKSKIEGCQKGH